MPEDVTLSGDVQGEGGTVQAGQNVETIAPTEPAGAVATSTPEPEPQPTVAPYDPNAGELEYLRRTIGAQTQQLANLRSQVEEYEIAGLDEQDLATYKLRQREAQVQAQEQQLRNQQAMDVWHNYYQGWGVKEVQGNNPAEWQHSVMTQLYTDRLNLAKKNQQLEQELKALKEAQVQAPKPEPTTTGSSKQGGQKTLWQHSWDALEDMHQKILTGQPPAGFPPLE